MKILVTGATGFLGTALSHALGEKEHDLMLLGSRDCDLTDQYSLSKLDNERFDQIFHLAAWTQAGDFCLHHPGQQWVVNQQINTHVLSWWHARQPQAKLISIGTSCAYSPDMELTEENYLDGRPIDSLFTYAMCKRMLYVGQLSLARQYGHKYLCLVPSTLYGPGYHTDDRQMHFIFDLVRKIMRGKLYDQPVVLWGDGFQRRELVFIEDFVRDAIVLSESIDNELINVGAGEEYTIQSFAETICRLVGYDFEKIQFDTSRYVGARSKCLAVDKLKQVLPEFQRTSLSEGLSATIDWFWENRDRLLPDRPESPQAA